MEYKPLKELAKITMGQSPESSSYNNDHDGLPFFQGNADFGEIYPEERVWCNNPKKVAQPKDILISVRAPIGALNYAKTECCIGRGLAAITVKNDELRNYIFHLLKARNGELNSKGTGSTFKAIGKSVLEELKVPVISVAEQTYCMQLLDIIENIIRQRRKELDHLDNLIKARFVEMFGDPEINPKGWKKEPLKDHAVVVVGYPFPSDGYTSEGIDIVGGYNLMQGYIQWEESKHWPDTEGYDQYLLEENDIVMAMDRPWVNGGFKIARVDATHLPALLIQRTARVRGKDLEQEFLHALLDTQRFAKHCNITGSLVPHISNKDINSFPVIIPPIEEQRRFKAFVAQVDKSKVTVQKALDEVQLLFDSLMQQFFG